MGNCYINIRFGIRHFQITHSPFKVSFRANGYHIENKPDKWLEIYDFFGLI